MSRVQIDPNNREELDELLVVEDDQRAQRINRTARREFKNYDGRGKGRKERTPRQAARRQLQYA